MTVAFVVSILITAMAAAFGSARVGTVSAVRSHVQAAADAAALAAVATSVPGRDGNPRGAAARFARLNDVDLVYCWCEQGDTAMQVRVRSGAVIATARAVFDPAALQPAVHTAGLHPELAGAVATLMQHAAGRLTVTSGHRSTEEQRALWTEAVARYGTPEAADDWVARPGTSAHERGLAVDLAGDLDLAVRLIARFALPLVRPIVHEPWHFELIATSP